MPVVKRAGVPMPGVDGESGCAAGVRGERPPTNVCWFDQDSTLAVRARSGCRDSFGVLAERHWGAIYRQILVLCRDEHQARDATQETFARALAFIGTYNPEMRFLTWLRTIARNHWVSCYRKASRRWEVEIDAVDPGELSSGRASVLDRMVAAEDERRLRAAVAALPDKFRRPIVLCYVDGLSYEQAAEELGLTLNNLKVRIHRGKQRLLKALGQGR